MLRCSARHFKRPALRGTVSMVRTMVGPMAWVEKPTWRMRPAALNSSMTGKSLSTT